jgi:hypothetical protein
VADPVGVAASGSEDDGVTSGETLGSACSLSLAHGDALSNGRLVHDADAAAASALEVAGTIPSIPLDCRMPSDTACGAAASRGLWGRGGRGGTAATAASDSTETARCTPSSSEPRRPFGVSLIIPMTSEAVTSPAEPCSSAVNSPVAEIATPTAGNSQATARTTAGQRKRAGSQRCIAIVKLCLRGHFTRTACRPPLNATVANTEVNARMVCAAHSDAVHGNRGLLRTYVDSKQGDARNEADPHAKRQADACSHPMPSGLR